MTKDNTLTPDDQEMIKGTTFDPSKGSPYPPQDTSLEDILDHFVQPGTKYLKDVQADIMAWHKQELAKVFERIRSEVEDMPGLDRREFDAEWRSGWDSCAYTTLESLNNIEKELI